MNRRLPCALLLAVAALVPAAAQAPATGSVVRLDPAFDEIVAPGTMVETLKDGFGFINGILWVREGKTEHLLVSDIPANIIHKWTPDGAMTTFLERPDWTRVAEARPAGVRFGANGIAMDRQGRIVYAAEADRALVRLEKDGKRTILADRYEGKRLNSPNDLVFRSDGGIYFTDPSGGNRFGSWDLKKELPYQGVFLLKDGKLQLLVQDLDRPNGIVLSADEKSLYVNDSNKKVIMRYDVQRDGTVANGRLFADMSAGKGAGNPDGMKFDVKGNLYSVGPGGIWVFNPAGKHIGMIVPPENAPGFAFGDPDGKTIYMAASSKLARVRVQIAGAGLLRAGAVAGQVPSAAASAFVIPKATYTPPKTPWGDPDLQGVWDNHNVIPMQRPGNLAGKKTFTDAELAAFAASRAGNGTDAVCTQLDEKCAKATVAEVDRVKAYNGWWTPLDYVKDNRTALIEDPADGRIPALTPEARAARDAFEKIHPPSDEDTANSDVKARHWEDFDTRTRCIAIQVPSGVMAYNSANYIIQSPGWVGIVLERLNTRWIPLDGRPHLGPKMRSWLGDSRGHWEGNTLVVETTNFLDQPTNGGGGSVVPAGVSQGNVRVIEHFVPVGPKSIHYYATLEDPKTWVRPWTFMQPWEKDRLLKYDDSLGRIGAPEPYQMYEYACHEGNHAIGAILKANYLEAQAGPKVVDTAATSKSLIGKTEAEIRAMFGAPVEIAGPRWDYGTADGILQFWAFFEGGKVVRVRPDDLPLDQIEKTP